MRILDLFGNEVDLPDPPRGRKKTTTMQEMFGVIEGKECRNCIHRFDYVRARTYHKCELWLKLCFPGRGHSEASDIRLKDTACGRFEEDDDA